MSPDWSAKVEPVPYSKLDDPQTLNLYAYVTNNPMTRRDLDGHCGGYDPKTGNMYCPADNLHMIAGPPPRNANGSLKGPPTPLPNGKNGEANEWVIKDSGKGTRTKWGPKYPVPSANGGQPSASWDDQSGNPLGQDHWDVKSGDGSTTRVTEGGKTLTPAEAHGFDWAPVRFDPERFNGAMDGLSNFVHDLVDYATHPHPNQGFTPGTGPPPPGGYIPVIPPAYVLLE